LAMIPQHSQPKPLFKMCGLFDIGHVCSSLHAISVPCYAEKMGSSRGNKANVYAIYCMIIKF
jgi:hypothetical protein